MRLVKFFFILLLINFAYSFSAFSQVTKIKPNSLTTVASMRVDVSQTREEKITYKRTINQWLPAIMVAGILAISIIAMVYAIGNAFNIDKLKIYASSEIPQVIGTLIFSILLITILELGSSLLISFEDSVLPQPSLKGICENINQASSVNLSPPNENTAYSLDAIYGIAYNATIPSNLAICKVIEEREGNEPYYFLASAEVILLNNTIKLLNLSNSLYNLHTILSFFQKITKTVSVKPIADVSFSPYAGMDYVASAVKDLEKSVIDAISFNFISIILLLFIYDNWVGLLMAGIFFRTFSFTRKLGGFLIALVISTIFITPLTYLLIYSTITNPPQIVTTQSQQTTQQSSGETAVQPQALFAPISMNPDPTIQPVCPDPSTVSGEVLQKITPAYKGFCGCYWRPIHFSLGGVNGILGWELAETVENFIPIPIPALVEGLSGYFCDIDTATPYVLYLESSEFFGRIQLETYFYPLIAFLVTLANILGLSYLFGGPTRIFGLEKLVR
jgi:hypothetical protein